MRTYAKFNPKIPCGSSVISILLTANDVTGRRIHTVVIGFMIVKGAIKYVSNVSDKKHKS